MKTLLLLAALISVVCCQTVWDGEWTDHSGIGVSQFVCTDPTSLSFFSLYSEAGVLVGNLTSNLRAVSGVWFEAGLGDCTSGTFQLYLGADGNSFSGLYTCGSSGAEIPIFETRLSTDLPTDAECGRFALSPQVPDGHYVSADSVYTYDICTVNPSNDDAPDAPDADDTGVVSYEASFEFPVQVTTTDAIEGTGTFFDPYEHGYQHGSVFYSGNVFKAFSLDSAGNKWAVLGVRSGRNYNLYLWCARNELGRALLSNFDSQCQRSITLARTGASSATQTCSRNSQYQLQLSSSQVPIVVPSSSSASHLAVAISSLLMVALFAIVF